MHDITIIVHLILSTIEIEIVTSLSHRHCHMSQRRTLAFHGKLFVIPKLGKCWGFSQLLGNVWDNIFLSWEMIGKSLGLFFPMLGSLWEMKGIFFKISMLVIQWVFSPEHGKMMGLFLHKLRNISRCYSQFWEMQGTRNPHLGKGLVKVRVKFSRCRV